MTVSRQEKNGNCLEKSKRTEVAAWIASPALADNPIIAEDHNTEKEEADMAAVEMKDKKKEMIEKTAQEFQKLNGDNQMFILGYMLGIQQERQRTTPQPQTA